MVHLCLLSPDSVVDTCSGVIDSLIFSTSGTGVIDGGVEQVLDKPAPGVSLLSLVM